MATYNQILKDIKSKKFAPIYLLMGDEAYFIDQITQAIADNVLTPDERAFNMMLLFGEDTEVSNLDNTARRYPMMAKYQVVIVKEAQKLKRIDDLVHYASKPSPTTILVLAYKYGTVAKNKKLYKAIDTNGVVLESKKLYDNQLPEWINEYFHEREYKIEPVAAAMIADNLGADLSKVANELDKLCMLVPKNQTISPADVERNIGISKDYNNFELQKIIGKKDVVKANQIINYFAQNQKDHHILATLSALFSYFEKLLKYHSLPDKNNRQEVAAALKVNPFFVKEYQDAARFYPLSKTIAAISILREYDMKSKGYGTNNPNAGDLLKELVFKIMH
jgi:DNA polymerase-3 subunit delta